VLRDVRQKEFTERGTLIQENPQLVLSEVLTREQAEVLALPPQALSLTELLGFIANLEERGQNAGRYRLALWQKLSLPVMTAAMIMLSLPFVFGPARSASLGWRIMAGAIIGVAFFFLNQILGYIGLITQISPAWTTFIPALALLAGGVFVSRKIA
jgi:lipopolysaccharide export system permease protein